MIASGVAFNRVAIAHRSVRIACGTPNCERIRAAHEVRRKVLVEKRAAPAMYRDRLLLHAAATDSAGTPSSTDSSAVSSAFAGEPRSPNSSPQSTHAPARRLVLVRLDLGVQAHFAVFVGRRSGVLRAERIVDDLVTGDPFRDRYSVRYATSRLCNVTMLPSVS